jgi:hypothetical protein
MNIQFCLVLQIFSAINRQNLHLFFNLETLFSRYNEESSNFWPLIVYDHVHIIPYLRIFTIRSFHRKKSFINLETVCAYATQIIKYFTQKLLTLLIGPLLPKFLSQQNTNDRICRKKLQAGAEGQTVLPKNFNKWKVLLLNALHA